MLELDRDVLVLPSTLARLVAARDSSGTAVAARVLPFDDTGASDRGCRLSTPGDGERTAVRAEAVAFRAVASPGPIVAADGRGSLLERASEAVSHEGAAVVSAALDSGAGLLLSVVMRTQVRRPEAIRDALLCLAGQRDGRFELLIVAHDVDDANAEASLAEQPAWLRDRAQVLRAEGGTRSRPLNVGFRAARGSHVAVLDDDDIVSADWVADLLAGAQAAPHRLIRTVVGVQRVAPADWPDGPGQVALDDVSTPYPAQFDLADHLRVNMTPFMAFAFPRRALEHIGGADERLEVCEDWDLVLRCAVMLGVVDVPRLTAVYRRWTSSDDSYSLHDSDVWERDMARVRSKLDAMPILMPEGSATMLAELSSRRGDGVVLDAVYASRSWRITAPLRALSLWFARRGARDI